MGGDLGVWQGYIKDIQLPLGMKAAGSHQTKATKADSGKG